MFLQLSNKLYLDFMKDITASRDTKPEPFEQQTELSFWLNVTSDAYPVLLFSPRYFFTLLECSIVPSQLLTQCYATWLLALPTMLLSGVILEMCSY